MYSRLEDTIVAVSSAPGHAARGIVRLSGPAAHDITHGLFTVCDDTGSEPGPGFVVRHGEIVLDDLHRLPAMLYLFRAPHSYTRQDMVEIHTVGSPPLLELIVERCLSAGARLAEPGEFSARAYLTGARSLTEAEAVASTIRARSDHQLRAARRSSQSELHRTIQSWQQDVADLLSLVVADIDFAEEPIDFISAEELSSRLTVLDQRLQIIIDQGQRGARFDVVPHVLLLGPPNAGKSSLLNSLSGMDRAIASSVSGTTRDILSAPVQLPGIEVVMLDAAGVDESADEVIAHGRQLALDAASTVELVVLVFDATIAPSVAEIRRFAGLANARTVIVGTKVDLIDQEAEKIWHKYAVDASAGSVCLVSTVTGHGLDSLKHVLENDIGQESDDGTAISLTTRQRYALQQAQCSIQRCRQQIGSGVHLLDVAELLAFDLNEALDSLTSITGAVTTEDLLHRVFASFCVGK